MATNAGHIDLAHITRVTNSALWAAVGDALGWITELGREDTIAARTGQVQVDRPLEWKRRVGGRGGVQVTLPSGTYSDDTQLRLAVCRSIRGDGVFDAEAFARVELTTWQCYALGAGLGSKAAASNLAKRGVNWFSNFFDGRAQSYPNAGGNGAAMRVQPHVWSRSSEQGVLLAVLRDALITHGHPHGFVGAAFHALTVSSAVHDRTISGPDKWISMAQTLRSLPLILEEDRQLSAFWRAAWETISKRRLEDAVEATVAELETDIEKIRPLLHEPRSYPLLLEELGLFTDRYRGSGLKTALAASALAWLYRDHNPEEGLVAAANALGSDTDTIATMAGAQLGACHDAAPSWNIQDREYLVEEAERLAEIAGGMTKDSFAYPDLARWQPPANQSDGIAISGDSLAVAGLGLAEPFGQEYANGDTIWQWLRLPFGQTILAKRRSQPAQINAAQLPTERRQPIRRDSKSEPPRQVEMPLADAEQSVGARPAQPPHRSRWTLDQITDEVINGDFDPELLGFAFNHVLDRRGSIEDIIAFSVIIAKAKIARAKRRGRSQ